MTNDQKEMLWFIAIGAGLAVALMVLGASTRVQQRIGHNIPIGPLPVYQI